MPFITATRFPVVLVMTTSILLHSRRGGGNACRLVLKCPWHLPIRLTARLATIGLYYDTASLVNLFFCAFDPAQTGWSHPARIIRLCVSPAGSSRRISGGNAGLRAPHPTLHTGLRRPRWLRSYPLCRPTGLPENPCRTQSRPPQAVHSLWRNASPQIPLGFQPKPRKGFTTSPLPARRLNGRLRAAPQTARPLGSAASQRPADPLNGLPVACRSAFQVCAPCISPSTSSMARDSLCV